MEKHYLNLRRWFNICLSCIFFLLIFENSCKLGYFVRFLRRKLPISSKVNRRICKFLVAFSHRAPYTNCVDRSQILRIAFLSRRNLVDCRDIDAVDLNFAWNSHNPDNMEISEPAKDFNAFINRSFVISMRVRRRKKWNEDKVERGKWFALPWSVYRDEDLVKVDPRSHTNRDHDNSNHIRRRKSSRARQACDLMKIWHEYFVYFTLVLLWLKFLLSVSHAGE